MSDRMRHRCIVALAVFAAIVAAPAAARAASPLAKPAALQRTYTPVAVFGPDDRVALPARYKRMQESIGLIFNRRSRSVCTAFCIGDRMVATASHCLFRTRGEQPPRLEDFWFARNYDKVRDYTRIAGYINHAAAQHVVAGSMALSVSPPIDATSDWAVVRLARPICRKDSLDILPMAPDDIAAEARAGHVFQVAYHRDFAVWKQAYSKPCPVAKSYGDVDWSTIAADFSNAAALVLHTCDTGGASSGSPLLVERPDGPKVVGINVGTYVQSKVIMRGGQTIQRMKPDTIANTGVAAIAFHATMLAFRDATVLSTVAALRDLQTALTKLGHYQGPLDGAYGAAMRTAIQAFERSAQQPATGIASEAILLKARAAVAATH